LETKLEYDTESIDTKIGTEFLGVMMDSTLQWKAHIDLLSMKLNAACYAHRTLKHTMSQQVLVMFFVLFPLDYVLQHNILGFFTPLY
jgi:hypothetical protein